MESFINSKEENIRKYKMSLLYIQTKELKTFYEKPMEMSPKYYYFINKDWLDKYKYKNNYNNVDENIIQKYSFCKDYADYRKKFLKEFNINETEIQKEDIEEDIKNKLIFSKKDKIKKYEISYELKGDLLNANYFNENICKFREFYQREIYVGNKTILAIDEENDNYAYSYSLVELPGYRDNFYIEINNILMFNDSDSLHKEFEEISSSNGINNYLINKNIDIHDQNEHNILDSKGNIVGKFINLKMDNSYGINTMNLNNGPISNSLSNINNQNNIFLNNNNKMPDSAFNQNSQNPSYLSNQNVQNSSYFNKSKYTKSKLFKQSKYSNSK